MFIQFAITPIRKYERRTDRPSQGSTGTPSDTPPCVTCLHTNQLLQGPAEGESRRAHLVRTASVSDLPSHAISSGRPIFIRFSLKSFYVGLCMVRYILLRKHLGTIPPIVLIPEKSASAWNRPRWVHLRPTTICHICRPDKPDPVAPFGDWRLPLLPLPSDGNRHS